MNGNNHPSSTRPMGSGNPQGPVAPRYGASQGAPPPQGRGDELIAGSNTVFEFTGNAAGGANSKGTFMGSGLDLSHADERRESNLKSGPSGWLFMGVAVLLAGGAIAWVMMGSSGETEVAAGEEQTPAVAAAAVAAPAADGEAQPAEASGEDAAASGGPAEAAAEAGAAAEAPAADDPTKAAEEPKAEEPKAEEPKAEEPKAEEPKAEEPKAEPKSEPKKKSTKKKTTTKKPSGGTTSGGGGGTKKGKTLKPKKPPRDPLSNLPKPPGG